MSDDEKGTIKDMLDDEEPVGNGDERPNTAMAMYNRQAELGPEDVYIPNLRLAQGLTPEVQNGEARPGQWLVTGFTPEPEVTVVPVAFFKRRELRDQGSRERVCASPDSVVGVGVPGGLCAECPMNEWQGEGDQRTPPKCTFFYEYIVYSDTHGTLALLKFAKTALKSGKVLNTVVAQAGLGNCAVRLKADAKQGPKGAFFSPTVVPTKVDEAVLTLAREKFEASVGT